MTTQATERWEPWMGVRIALIEDGMSQEELADLLGWDPAKISRTVNGKRRIYIDEIQAIAKAQGRELSWYLNGFDQPEGGYVAILSQPLVAA